MVKSAHSLNHADIPKKAGTKEKSSTYNLKKLSSMGKLSADLLNKLYRPIDTTNRFINLALRDAQEDSNIRQFLLESKSGLRTMSDLLKRMSGYARKMEKELYEISKKTS